MKVLAEILRALKRPRTGYEILAHVWQLHPQDAPHVNCIRVHICRLRKQGHRIELERAYTNTYPAKQLPGTYRLLK